MDGILIFPVPGYRLHLVGNRRQRFIRYTMQADEAEVAVAFPQFFGHPLERHIAPRHAFLVAKGRASGG